MNKGDLKIGNIYRLERINKLVDDKDIYIGELAWIGKKNNYAQFLDIQNTDIYDVMISQDFDNPTWNITLIEEINQNATLKFYDYQAYISVVQGLAIEGKTFTTESHVNKIGASGDLDHWIIIIKE